MPYYTHATFLWCTIKGSIDSKKGECIYIYIHILHILHILFFQCGTNIMPFFSSDLAAIRYIYIYIKFGPIFLWTYFHFITHDEFVSSI